MRGKLIVIEGLDGAGKSTLADRLEEAIAPSHPVKRYAEPGGTALSDSIRDLLKDPGSDINSHAEALLFAAARAQLADQLRSDLEQGIWVILDRWIYSSVAYQGSGRGLTMEAVEDINRWAVEGLQVDAWVYLRLTTSQAQERRLSRGQPVDRIEAEQEEFFVRVGEGYERQAAEDSRAVVLSASLPPDELAEKALLELEHLFR